MNETPDAEVERERLERFAARLDAIRGRVEKALGGKDVAYVKKVRAASRALGVPGRTSERGAPTPVRFAAGVSARGPTQQLEATEIGHSALHGAWDGLAGAEEFAAKGFDWRVPIDEQAWHQGHNLRHHGHTNIAGKDPDVHFGPVRLNERTPHRAAHYVQLPMALFAASTFGLSMNLHFTGVVDHDGTQTPAERREAWRMALRKYVPYYKRELVTLPLLSGPFAARALLGNLITEVMRDLYSAATIFCGHVGDEVADYPEGTRAQSRAEWYRMQVEAANDFEVPLPVSMLCGALDRQIEHHLFPRFPPNRLREIAPEVRAACEEAGIPYRSASWPATLGKVVSRLWKLSFPTAAERAERAARGKSAKSPTAIPASTTAAATTARPALAA